MSLAVYLTDAAARDLDELYAGAYERGGRSEATSILDRIEVVLRSLAEGQLPTSSLPLLERLGATGVRQHVSDDGMRFVFQREGDRVALVSIARADRSFQSLLQRRVLDG